jgi:NADH-quinone oxidoreductase subunit J
MTVLQIIFLVAAAITLSSAVMVVSARRMIHAALWLVLALLGVAILFALLEIRFFAIVQVLIYIGAIAILIIFAVMLTQRSLEDVGSQLNRGWWVAILACFGIFLGLVGVLSSWGKFQTITRTIPAGGEDILSLGKAFVDPAGYVIPFEVASVLLLAALVGAIFVASERKEGKR